MTKDFFTLLGGFLTNLLAFFTIIGVSFGWFTTESINAFVLVLSSGVALFINGFAIWKNTYVSRKGLEQKDALKEKDLI